MISSMSESKMSDYERLKTNNSVDSQQEISRINVKGPVSDHEAAKYFYNTVRGNYLYFKGEFNKTCLLEIFKSRIQSYNEIIKTCSICVKKLEQVSDKGIGYKDEANKSKIYLEKMKKLYEKKIKGYLEFESEFPKLTGCEDSRNDTALQESESSTLKFRHGKKKIKFNKYVRSAPIYFNRLPTYKL